MGSVSPDHHQPAAPLAQRKEWRVLVTGFGPFLTHDVNPSHLIAAALPSHVTLPHLDIDIHIDTPPEPLQVSYAYIQTHLPRLILHRPQSTDSSHVSRDSTSSSSGGLKYDLVLHLGLAAGRQYYAMETQAHGEAYVRRDIYGQTPALPTRDPQAGRTRADDEQTGCEEEQTGCEEEQTGCGEEQTSLPLPCPPHAPALLKPVFDAVDVWKRWRRALESTTTTAATTTTTTAGRKTQDFYAATHKIAPQKEEVDVRLSLNAGLFLCEYVFYSSMAWSWRCHTAASQDKKEGDGGRVMFCHVPPGTATADVDRGVRVVLGLVQALVESLMAAPTQDGARVELQAGTLMNDTDG